MLINITLIMRIFGNLYNHFFIFKPGYRSSTFGFLYQGDLFKQLFNCRLVIEFITFRCIDCGKEDEVPDYVVEEFYFDFEENEEVEVVCPFCNATMRQARKKTQ